MFCIHGGDEQRQIHLGPRNFVRLYNPDCFTYIEHGLKNYSARAKDLHYEKKEVPCPAIPEERPKCLVFLMDFYQSKLPTFAFENNILYLRPKCTTPQAPNASWYDNVPVGNNTLQSMVKDSVWRQEFMGKLIIACMLLVPLHYFRKYA